ncbi:MAG TPA: response regulator transcription factor [Gemmatimonadales bacterium]|jgi:DNA-binding NarL/FixJ family response regulator|nr:response regulator transcription factor [Gemmatimonadales bacterium]
MIRLLIADDHPVVREGLRRIVEDAPGLEVVSEVASGHELLTQLRRVAADIILLDVSMPGPGFLELLQRLRIEHPTVAVLVLSVHPEDQYAVRALRAGAAGYLTKDHSPEELTEAIRRVHRGHRYVSQGLAERLAADLAVGAGEVQHEALSNREYEVLCLLGSGRQVKEIASTLQLSPKTVSTYRTRILEKMNATSNADLVRYAALHGLIR